MKLQGRNFTTEKTSISDIPNLREVRNQLLNNKAKEIAKNRIRLRRQFRDVPLSLTSAKIQNESNAIATSYKTVYFATTSGAWVVQSTGTTGSFLAQSLKAGSIGLGDTVRGYHRPGNTNGWIEPQPQGRRFAPAEDLQFVIEEEELAQIPFDLFIAFTGFGNYES